MAAKLYDEPRLAAIYGVAVDTLRLYERRGLLRPILIGGIRYFTTRDRVRLEIILKGKRLGLDLVEIERLLLGVRAFAAKPVGPDTLALDRVIGELRQLEQRRDDLDALIAALQSHLQSWNAI